ncbi:TPA: ead/Ea22-like family protein [Escherichia coli]|uniref:Ead/Ea22-like family protein n=1 Tax=Escherichia coli TaxID=562 RepID=A0A8S7NUS8_ECOLX|nr:ead/Ea22-like family protein [Escherichia coli]HDQ6864980.1 ead/Ea22-like family protein [Escherichia coli O176:H4]EEQ6056902.1 ead/Ea22-like family protein [Escherichia coli]EER0449696.1 ead/Ea22-like family protein [Escherichia coli]EER3338223.1 ead/Ea22-like family protein [Escherichia coli]EES5163268.1 ead/Ea22-like family protein [Escherichia coli]
MNGVSYQALRLAAENATPGEWCTDDYGVIANAGLNANYYIASCSGPDNRANKRFIAAANPATVLALLDERERNQQYIKSRDQENEDIALTVGKLRVELEAAEKRNAKLQSENAYIRNRFKELDLLIGKNILVMQAAIIEWQATGDAKSGLAWIYNTLFGPGELPDESEKDAQAYFNRKYAPIDEKLMALHKWFWEQSEAERAAGIRIKGE